MYITDGDSEEDTDPLIALFNMQCLHSSYKYIADQKKKMSILSRWINPSYIQVVSKANSLPFLLIKTSLIN